MSVTLEDARGESLQINAWNWGVLHFAVACAKPPLFDDEEFLELLRHGGATLTQNQAADMCKYLQQVVLPRMSAGQRMMFDFSVTSEPDDGTFYRDDLSKNYSLRYQVLKSVIAFLQNAQAPIEVN